MQVKEAVLLRGGAVTPLSVGQFYESATHEKPLLNIYPVKRQTVLGFGGAFTDSAAYNYSLLDDAGKQEVLEALFGTSGLGYTFCRLCIASSDFAPEPYGFLAEGDTTLATFSIDHDRKYILPFVKDALAFTGGNLTLFASPWSPPAFMKDNQTIMQGGKLLPQYYELYAEYLIKFLRAYAAEGVAVSMLTLQNEAKAKQTWESCTYTAEEEAAFAKVLRTALDSSEFAHVKLLFWDHNKERLYDRASVMYRESADTVAGIAFHWYSGDHFDGISLLREMYPDKLLLQTEFCISGGSDQVEAGYAHEILGDLTHGANAICEWNLILDENGGPYHNRPSHGGCDAPIRIDSRDGSLRQTEIYREMYLFSHFIRPGAVALATSTFDTRVTVAAFENPNGEIVVNVISERDDAVEKCKLYLCGKFLDLALPARAKLALVIEK